MSVAESIPEMTLQDMMGRVAFPDSATETPENRIIFRPKNQPTKKKPQNTPTPPQKKAPQNPQTEQIPDDGFAVKKTMSEKVEERELLTERVSYRLYQEYP